MIIAVHILSLLFSYFNGRHDIPAVDSFTDHGSAPKPQAIFHNNNFSMKLTFVAAVFLLPMLHQPFSIEFAIDQALAAIAGGLDIWLIFDPVIALGRSNKQDLFYLSDKNPIDRTLKIIAGKNAGVWKSLFCLLISIGITIYLLSK